MYVIQGIVSVWRCGCDCKKTWVTSVWLNINHTFIVRGSHSKPRTDLSLWKSICKCFFLVSSLSPTVQITIEIFFLKHCSPLFPSLVSCQKTTTPLKFFSKTTREAPLFRSGKILPLFPKFCILVPLCSLLSYPSKWQRKVAYHLPCSPLFPSLKWRSITFTHINCAERSPMF